MKIYKFTAIIVAVIIITSGILFSEAYGMTRERCKLYANIADAAVYDKKHGVSLMQERVIVYTQLDNEGMLKFLDPMIEFVEAVYRKDWGKDDVYDTVFDMCMEEK